MRFARRLTASLRRAVDFYKGRARVVLVVIAGLAVGGIALSSALPGFLMTGALVLGTALIVYAGSRAHSTQQASSATNVSQLDTDQAGTAGRDGPLVTVIVTAHNDGRFIETCLESIRLQTWASWECILVDDASTDDTVARAIDQLGTDPRFRILSLPDQGGVSSARNLALAVANGPFVTFLDADDFLYVQSLELRAEELEASSSRPGVAGVYCDWVGVPEHSELVPQGRPAMRRRRISWMEAADWPVVISSAPMVLTSEIRRLGGFRESWVEDADLWNRLLRHGYVLDPVAYNGVAYRQKAHSRFRSSAGGHTVALIGLVNDNRRPIEESELVPGTPPVFTEAIDAYRGPIGRIRRALTGLTTAWSAGDAESITDLTDRVIHDWIDVAWAAVDVDTVVLEAAMRHEAYVEEGRVERARRTTDAVLAFLSERIPPLEWVPGPLAEPAESPSVAVREVRRKNRPTLGAAKLKAAIEHAVVLMPSVQYHVDELGPLAEELYVRGRPVVMAVSDRRWSNVRSALAGFEIPIVAAPEPGDWVAAAAGYVTLNDWGEVYRDIILAADAVGVPTFAKVEGAQDFADADVLGHRRPYRTVSHVLCQGQNDVDALSGQSTHIVGSSRLETIWRDPPRQVGEDLVVINSNFTYGVLAEAREGWVSQAIAACEQRGIKYVVSKHPAEPPIQNEHVAMEPMRHLLTKASILISRFSTVPFEAMARGVPFIYFNPHGEKVPTFRDPRGAFEIATSQHELESALEVSQAWRDSYRDRCRDFFLSQVDIDLDARPAERGADVIESTCFP